MYNRNFESDNNNENVEFLNVDLLCNKFNIQLIVNNSITYTKERHTDDNRKKVISFQY